MQRVLFLFAPILLIAGACQDQVAAAEEAVAKGQVLRDQAAEALNEIKAEAPHDPIDYTIVEEWQYDDTFDVGSDLNAHAYVHYFRFHDNMVGETVMIQMPAHIPENEPFIRGRWVDSQMEPAQICQVVTSTEPPQCGFLAEAPLSHPLRRYGERLLREAFRLIQPQLRRRFNNRGRRPPATSSPRAALA